MHISKSAVRLSHKSTASAILTLLLASVVAISLAPLLMPSRYSWLDHAVSEAAAQGQSGAWLTRLGFLLLGFAVLLLAAHADSRWGVWGRLLHRVYGLSMIATAVFAHKPFVSGTYDRVEDVLHSIAANAVGFAFVAGVIVVTMQRGDNHKLARVIDWIAIVAAIALPLIMVNITGYAGLAQRILFAIGYLWYGMETVLDYRDHTSMLHFYQPTYSEDMSP